MTSNSHPTSRRTFTKTIGLSTASALLAPAWLNAKEKGLRPFSFIVVSDTHLGYKDRDSAARQWEKTAAELAEAPGEFVLHLGDVVDGGREAQYPVYLAAREKIGKPVYEIPGNHDPHELFAKHVRREIDTSFDRHGVRFVLLGNAHPDSHDGFFTAAQLRWLDERCREAADKGLLVIVCAHVPIHANKHPDRGWYVKTENGQTEFYELAQRHRERLLAVLHGHFHNGIRGWNDHGTLHEVCCPSVLYNLDRRLEQQNAPGYNPVEFRPGYLLATLGDGQLTLRYKPLGADVSIAKKCHVARG